MKKILSIILALCIIAFGSSLTAFAATETPVSISADNLGRGSGLVGLTVIENADGSVLSKSSNISFYLPETVEIGETVTVHMKGSSNGDFRVWLIDVNEHTNTEIYQMSQNDFTSGEFDKTFTLTNTADAATDSTEIFFKAPTWDGKVDNLNITYLTVTKASAEEAAAEVTVADDAVAEDTAADTTAAPVKAVPKTGETTNAVTYIVLMAVALGGFALTRKRTVTE